MYYDLFLPFPQTEDAVVGSKKKAKDKGKAKAPAPTEEKVKSCWQGIDSRDGKKWSRDFALSAHLGYSVVGCTIARDSDAQVYPSPFVSLPFPNLDPRTPSSSSSKTRADAPGSKIVQVTRYHFKLEHAQQNPLTSGNTSLLAAYDILSCQPMNDKALQQACTDLSNPGPNQLSIITLPLHERAFSFRFNRKQIKQAQRNGVAFEILYSAALFPNSGVPPEMTKKYRQNWMSNARELIRVTDGKGIIFSSGPNGGGESLRGPADVINLGTILGVPANLAKDAVDLNPKMVLLKAQARKTFKGVLSVPRVVPAPKAVNDVEQNGDVAMVEKPSVKRPLPTGAPPKKKKIKAS